MNSTDNTSPLEKRSRGEEWIGWSRRSPGAKLTVYVFPHAGASAAAYSWWANHIAADLDLVVLEMPGRWGRPRERPCTTMDGLSAPIAGFIAAAGEMPFVLLGYSLGALIAYDVARRLYTTGARAPEGLVAIASRAPHLKRVAPFLHQLPDRELCEKLEGRYGPLPRAIREDEETLAFVLRGLRADVTILERYEQASTLALPFPIAVFGGAQDVSMSMADLEAWVRHTKEAFRLAVFEGGHFFVNDGAVAFFPALVDALRSLGRGARMDPAVDPCRR